MRINMTKLSRYSAPERGDRQIAEFLRKFFPASYVTYNYKGGYFGGTNVGPVATPGVYNVGQIELDFAAIAAARVAAGQAALGAADVLELFGMKAGVHVLMAAIQTTRVEGAAATFDLGDGASAAGFISNHDGNALGFSSSLVTSAYSVAVGGGRFYSADDTVDLVLDSASVDAAILVVSIATVDFRNNR